MRTDSIIRVTHPPGTEPRYYQVGSVPGTIGWKMALDGLEPGYAATRLGPYRPFRRILNPTQEQIDKAEEITPPTEGRTQI